MYSRAAFWKDGSMRWSVAHDGGDVGRDHLQVDGEPPASLPTLEADARAAQEAEEGVDYVFDVPTGLVRELTGFQYDSDELTLAVLEPVPGEGTKRSLLARLLGRG